MLYSFYRQVPAGNPPVYKLFSEAISSFFSPRRGNSLHRRVKFGVEESIEFVGPKTENFMEFRNINAPRPRIPWTIF